MKTNKNEPDKPYPWACGFCGPGSTRKPGVCYDKHHRCPGWVAGVECACAAAQHYTVAARPVETVELIA